MCGRDYVMLFAIFLKKPKRVFSSIPFQKLTMGQFCYLRLSLGIDTVSCRLLLRMGRMNMDSSLKNLDQIFLDLM